MTYDQSLICSALVAAKSAGGYVTEDLTLAYYAPNAFQSNEVLLNRARENAVHLLAAIDAAIASGAAEIVRAADEHDADKATIAALVAALHEVVEQHGKRFGAFDELCDSSVQPPDIQRAMAALALTEGQS